MKNRKDLIDAMCKKQLTNQEFMNFYDDLRTQTCNNCDWYDPENMLSTCAYYDNDIPTGNGKNFGCKEGFKRKE